MTSAKFLCHFEESNEPIKSETEELSTSYKSATNEVNQAGPKDKVMALSGEAEALNSAAKPAVTEYIQATGTEESSGYGKLIFFAGLILLLGVLFAFYQQNPNRFRRYAF